MNESKNDKLDGASLYKLSRTEVDPRARSKFLVRTYFNLTGAVLLFAAIELILFATVDAEEFIGLLRDGGRATGIVYIAICIGGSLIAELAIGSKPSRPVQYGLLVFYAILYSVLFIPILAYASLVCGTSIIYQAIGITGSLFVLLSASVFATRADFSFLRAGLVFFGLGAIVMIIASCIFGFELGAWFSALMIGFACAYILHDTSRLIHECQPDEDVFAAVELFGSLMTLFFYVLDLLPDMPDTPDTE